MMARRRRTHRQFFFGFSFSGFIIVDVLSLADYDFAVLNGVKLGRHCMEFVFSSAIFKYSLESL